MRSPDAEGEGDGDRPRLVSVKRTTGTERPGASLFERKARVCDANSEVQGASSEADAALTFWLLLGQAKSNGSYLQTMRTRNISKLLGNFILK